MNNKLNKQFYTRSNVTDIARDLLGKFLWTNFDNNITVGKIVETEAYCGATDRACHAFPDKRTERTEVMFREGGYAYIYFVYGMHHLFNIVTNVEGRADAVLIRAIEPVEGEDIMKTRRSVDISNRLLTGGPARLTKALGIDVSHNNTKLSSNTIWLTDGESVSEDQIVATTRIGVDYAGDDAYLPWRYYIKGNKYVSK
ncbi:MAG: DNA-3-methyladenine glycosylase [Bacteroidota bacterium]